MQTFETVPETYTSAIQQAYEHLMLGELAVVDPLTGCSLDRSDLFVVPDQSRIFHTPVSLGIDSGTLKAIIMSYAMEHQMFLELGRLLLIDLKGETLKITVGKHYMDFNEAMNEADTTYSTVFCTHNVFEVRL